MKLKDQTPINTETSPEDAARLPQWTLQTAAECSLQSHCLPYDLVATSCAVIT